MNISDVSDKKQVGIFNSHNIAFFAVMLSLIILLQVFGSYIQIGVVRFSFVLVPIVLGGVLMGRLAGALLGFAFGIIVIIMGFTGADGFTNYLLSDSPLLTVALCIVKGVAAGYGSACAYRLISGKNKTAATYVAAVAAPVLNTGIFILGGLLLSGALQRSGFLGGDSVIYFLIVGCAGINFLVEFAINIVFAPSLCRVAEIINKNNHR